MTSGQERGADILLVASHAPDLAGMRPYLGERLDGVVRNLRITAKIVGLGGAVAAAACARGILAVQPRVVVMLGTCGVYPHRPQYRPYDVIVPAKAHLLCHAALAGRAAYPDPMTTSVECHPLVGAALEQSHPRAFRAAVASPLAITTDDPLAAAVSPATGWEAENLELFGIATACAASSVSFGAALGVTHVVGSTGRHDWASSTATR